MLQSLKYSCLVQHQISVINYIDNRLYFNFVSTPFRSYNGKVVTFMYDDGVTGNTLYSGTYKYNHNDTLELSHFIEIENFPTILSDTVLNVYESFKVSKDNELVTTQDIHDLFIAEVMELSGTDNQIKIDKAGKSGLISSIDNTKISRLPVIVKSTEDLIIGGVFQTILNIKETPTNRYNILLTSSFGGVLDAEISFDNRSNPGILIKVNHCSFVESENLRFTLSRLSYSDSKFIRFNVSSVSEEDITYNFSYGSPNIESLILPSGNIESTSQITISDQPIFVIDSKTLSITTKSIQKIASSDDLASSSLTSENLISDVTIAGTGIVAGDNLSLMNLDAFVKKLVQKTFYPTYVAPTVTVNSSMLNNGSIVSVESGTIDDITLSVIFNRGSILGKKINNIWNPTTFQNYRSGQANNFVINGINNDLSSSLLMQATQIIDGPNQWNVNVSYDEGIQPVDSKDINYQLPLVAGSLNGQKSINGQRYCFYGCVSDTDVEYDTSEQIRLLPLKILNPIVGTSFNIRIPVGTKMIVISYPASIRDISSIKYVEGSNVEIKGIFGQSLISVSGANNYLPIDNNVFTYIPVSPFEQEVNYLVTI